MQTIVFKLIKHKIINIRLYIYPHLSTNILWRVKDPFTAKCPRRKPWESSLMLFGFL